MKKLSLFFNALKSKTTPVLDNLMKSPLQKEIEHFKKNHPDVPYVVKYSYHSLRPGVMYPVPYVEAAVKKEPVEESAMKKAS